MIKRDAVETPNLGVFLVTPNLGVFLAITNLGVSTVRRPNWASLPLDAQIGRLYG